MLLGYVNELLFWLSLFFPFFRNTHITCLRVAINLCECEDFVRLFSMLLLLAGNYSTKLLLGKGKWSLSD